MFYFVSTKFVFVKNDSFHYMTFVGGTKRTLRELNKKARFERHIAHTATYAAEFNDIHITERRFW